jgi:hypothetical protein
MARDYWVWYERPGLPHTTAHEYGGRSFGTLTAAIDFTKAQLKAGFIVRIYAADIGGA